MSEYGVSELLALRIENASLKMAQFQELYLKMLTEQRQHIETARVDVAAPNEWIYDLNSRTFKPETTS